MQGSKYTDEQRETARAMFARGLSPAKVAGALHIPRSTAADWRARTLESGDEDYLAMRREKLRRLMGKSWSIVDHGLSGMEKTVKAAHTDRARIDKLILMAQVSAMVDADTAKELVKLLRRYGEVSLSEITRATGDAMKICDALETALIGGMDGERQVVLEFEDAEGLSG